MACSSGSKPATYTVVTPSLRGFGKSSAPTDSASIDIYADDMLAIVDALQIDTGAVLGMSMGDWILLDMYEKAPERFTALAFNDTAAAPASLDVPTLFLFGIEDTLTPANLAQSMAEKVSDSTAVVVAGASHAAMGMHHDHR